MGNIGGCVRTLTLGEGMRAVQTSSEATLTTVNDDEQTESVIDQSPRRVVGDRVYVSVPGPVPMVRAKRAKPKKSA
jgi:hypothetical protein